MKLNRLKVLTKEEIIMIHNSTIALMEDVGVKVDSEEACRLLKDNGAEIDSKKNLVKFPEYLIKDQLKKVPNSFSLYGPDDQFRIDINTENIHFATQGAPTKIYDNTNPLQTRDARLSDFIKFLKITDSLEYISCSHLDVWPVDIPYSTLHCHAIKEWVKNSRKPFGIGCRGKIMSKDLMYLLSIIVNGKDKLIKKPRLLGFFNPISPLTLPRVLLGGLFIFAQYKQPLIIASSASGGLNAPITLAGLLTQTNAEVLSSIVLTQLINSGAPVLYGTVNTPIDPRTGNVAWGSIETSLITIASAQLARFYKIPSRASGSITNSIGFDIQNGFERFNTLSAAAYAGINYITCAGTYECGLASSLELLVIDDELIGMVSRGLNGIKVDPNTMALNEIKSVASDQKKGLYFLGLRHTAKNIKKELYIPKLSERGSRNTWIKKGSLDFITKSQIRIEELLKNHKPKVLKPNLEKEIDSYIKKVEERNINEYIN
ncbi:MAG: trimethylamine methyltransferase family protein [Promethearchaeota archaeon]